MEEIRQEALDSYSNCSMEVKTFAQDLFDQMDRDGSASISYAELSAFVKENKVLSRLKVDKKLFKLVDENGNGRLDFTEYITFFYLVFASSTCDGCCAKLMGQRRFTCRICFATASNTFDLCVTCFSAKIFKHQHDDFLDFSLVANESSVTQTNKVKDNVMDMDKATKVLEKVHTVVEVTGEVVQALARCNIM